MQNLRPRTHIRLEIWSTKTYTLMLFRAARSFANFLVQWNHTDNTFKVGQWLMKKRVYSDRSLVTPDGKYFIYFYLDYKDSYNAYTVVSQLDPDDIPRFTAISLYGDDAWTGGCRFRGDRLQISYKKHLMFGEHYKLRYKDGGSGTTFIDTYETPEFTLYGTTYRYDKETGILYNGENIIFNAREQRFKYTS